MSISDDLTLVCFRDVAWLQSYPLNESTVLDYFALSQFYERTCNNEVLRMQTRFTDNEQLLNQLHTLTGIEFAVIKTVPPRLFIIAKRMRISPHKASIVSCYYVLNGSIYMAPDLKTVLKNRLTSSMFLLNAALEYGRRRVEYDIGSGLYQASHEDQQILSTTEQAQSMIHADEYKRIDQSIGESLQFLDALHKS